MACAVEAAPVAPERDAHQLDRHAVSPLVEPAILDRRDAEVIWQRDVGLVVRPTGPRPSFAVPMPLVESRDPDVTLTLDVSVASPGVIEVGWQGATCPTPSPPCTPTRLSVPQGRHRIPVAIPDAIARDADAVTVALPGLTTTATIHAIRRGAIVPLPDDAARDIVVASPDRSPTITVINDATATFARGAGLRVTLPTKEPGAALAPFIGFAVGHDGRHARYLEVETRGVPSGGLLVYFAGSACPQFSETCVTVPTHVAPGVFVVDLGSHPNGWGRIEAIRVDLIGPARDAGAHVEIPRIVFVRASRYRERLAQRSDAQWVLGPHHAPSILAAHQLDAKPTSAGGLRLTPQAPSNGVPHAPSLTLATRINAGDTGGHLVVESTELVADSIGMYFMSAACPSLGEACRSALRPSDPGRWAVDLSRVETWRGGIDALRFDLPATTTAAFTISAIRYEPPTSTTNTEAFRGVHVRGAQRLSRLPEGRLGWELAAGERLTCRWADDRVDRRAPPTSLALRIPPISGAIDFGAIEAVWTLPTGERVAAAHHVEAFADPRARAWTTLDLTPAPALATGLEVTLRCHENCRASADRSRVVHVAQPVHRVQRTAAATRAPRHVLMVSLDTLRADHLPMYGYPEPTAPFLTSFAERATVYDRAWAVDTWTVPTHAAMLTGRYPTWSTREGMSTLPLEVTTLAEHLGAHGWATLAAADGIILTAAQGLDQGFDRFDSRFEPLATKREAFTREVADAVDDGVPVFAFLHTYQVHNPYIVPPGPVLDETLADPARGGFPVRTTALEPLLDVPAVTRHRDAMRRYLVAHYDASIRVADAELAALFGDPRLQRFLEDAVIVITADHGEEFFEHGSLTHGHQLLYPELLHVPLLMRTPGQQASTRVATPTSQTAIPGLVVEALGLPPIPTDPCASHPHPLAAVVGRGPSDFPTNTYLTTAAFDAHWQLMRTRRRDTGAVVRETTTALVPSPPDAAPPATLGAALDCLERAMPHSAAPVDTGAAPPVGAAERERLRALGYAE